MDMVALHLVKYSLASWQHQEDLFPFLHGVGWTYNFFLLTFFCIVKWRVRRIKEKTLLHKNKKEGTENECVFRDITTEYEELAVKSSDRRVLPVVYGDGGMERNEGTHRKDYNLAEIFQF